MNMLIDYCANCHQEGEVEEWEKPVPVGCLNIVLNPFLCRQCAEKARQLHKIKITVEGGLIQDIENIPDNVVIEVRDYDNEGLTPDDPWYGKDEEGRECAISEWEAESK